MINLSTDQQLPLSVAPLTAAGKAGAIVGAPAWSLSDATLAVLAPGADANSILLVPNDGATGNLTVTVDCKVDHGAGPVDLTAALAVTLAPPEAASVQINSGAPTAKPGA